MGKLRNKSSDGLYGGNRNRYRETDSNKRYTTDPDLIQEYMERLDITYDDAKFLVGELVDSIRTVVNKNGSTTIRRLGTFHLGVTKRSKMFVPRTGEEVKIPLRYKIRFAPANSFKNFINGKVKKNISAVNKIRNGK